MEVSAKETLIKFIESLPENLTEEQIAYSIFVREDILKGHEDVVARKGYSTDEIIKMVKQWAK